MKSRLRKDNGRQLALAPLDEALSPQKRMQAAMTLSELVMRMVTYVVCHTIVDHRDLLGDERLSVAHGFLQRVATTHLCNQKLTAEGIVYEYDGQQFELHEQYKTMTLTRSVYEHLAMFFFLFEHPRTPMEREVVWKYWQIGSKKNFLDYGSDTSAMARKSRGEVVAEIERLRSEMLSATTDAQCCEKLDRWTRIGSPTYGGSIEFVSKGARRDVRRVSYSQAWRYLFGDEAMTLFYPHLSMHCHPVYDGLLQYQDQTDSDRGHDAIPLFFSCCFASQLCRLFLRQLPEGEAMLRRGFSEHDRQVFATLATLRRL